MQAWQGYVIDVDGDTFRARLSPVSGEKTIQEIEIYISAVPTECRSIIEPGIIFNLDIEDKTSNIRLPKWAKKDFEVAEKKAKELKALLG